ncbi:MAG: hypothetical protein R3E87_27245 [Burkholderiaceae bacterium]
MVALLLAAPVAAQVQKPCFVHVVDGDGHALAGAEVTLLWQPYQGMPGVEHVVRLTTDERGRCQPRLAVGQLYTAWAIGPAREHGSRWVSEPTGRAAAGGVLELRADHAWRARRVVVSQSGEGSADDGGEFVHLAFPLAGLAEELKVVEGAVELPPAPWSRSWVARRAANGTMLQACAVEPWVQEPQGSFRAPGTVTLQVVDAGGEAIEQVSVSSQLRLAAQPADCVLGSRGHAWFRELVVGGGAELLVPDFHTGEPLSPWLVVTAPGHRERWVSVPRSGGSAAEPLRVELAAPRELQVRVVGLHDGEQVAAQLVLAVNASSPGANYTITNALPFSAHDGVLTLPLPANVLHWQLFARLLPSEGAGRVRTLVLPEVRGEPQDADVDVAELRAVALTVRGADGSLAAAAEVAVFEVEQRASLGYGDERVYAVTDVAGRADLLLGKGMYGIYATDGRAHVLHFVDPEELGGDVELQLETIPTVRCRVVDEQGQPVAGARFEPHQSRMSGFSGALRGAKGWAKEGIAADVAYPLVLSGRSGADGSLVVPLQDWRPWHAGFRVRAGERVSEPLQFPLDSDHGDVVVR